MITLGLENPERPKAEERSITLGDFPGFARLMGSPVTSGVVVNEFTALNFSAFFNGVDIISGQIAALPRIVYRRLGDDERERAVGLPAYRILKDRPNPYATPMVFWQTAMAHVLTWGNFYAEIEFDKANRPIALWNIMPDKIEPTIVDEKLLYRYTPTGRTIKPEDMLHVPGLGFDGVKGYSVVSMARRSLSLGIAAEAFGSAFFGNNALPGMILEHPKTLSKEAQVRIKDSWNNAHQGPGKSQGLAILEEGMKANKLTIPPDDAQFLQSREFQVVEMARWLNLPPHKLKHKVGERPGGNIEASQIEFLTDTLNPWLARIEQECTRKLLPDGGDYYAEHLVDNLLRMDAKARAENYKIYKDMGVMDEEQIARKENLPKPKPRPAVVAPMPPAPAAAEPPPPPARAREAFRALVADVTVRFVRREAERARRASKKGAGPFQEWVEEFYSGEAEALASHLAPCVALALAQRGIDTGAEAIAASIAAEYLSRSKQELLDLKASDLAGSVDHRMKKWEATRPWEVADKIAAIDAAEGVEHAA